jgi:hypothetical protein
MPQHRIKLVTIVAALALTVTVTPSLAGGTGGKGHGPNSVSSSSPALTGVTYAGGYTVTGTGFQPGETVTLNIGEAGGCCNALNVVADAAGTFASTRALVGPGTYTVRAAELVRGNWQFVAQWSFDSY